MEYRNRVLSSALVLAILWSLGDILLLRDPGASVPLAREIGLFIARLGSILVAAGFLSWLRHYWYRTLRRTIIARFDALERWTRRWLPEDGSAPPEPRDPISAGKGIALTFGLVVAALDVVLTSLLLKDVFPEPPYRLPVLEGPVSDWAFYAMVASLKTILALWFGISEAGTDRSTRWRWLVLGGASAFDALLALARGYALADQGLTGAPIMVSNLVFAGFGVAIPWVVAHTGRSLAEALEPLLARWALLRRLGAVPRLLFVGLVWVVALAIAIPVGVIGLGLGLAAALWTALDEFAALLWGHRPEPPAPILVLDERPTEAVPTEAIPPGTARMVEGALS